LKDIVIETDSKHQVTGREHYNYCSVTYYLHSKIKDEASRNKASRKENRDENR
jgi:hypothetical protein